MHNFSISILRSVQPDSGFLLFMTYFIAIDSMAMVLLFALDRITSQASFPANSVGKVCDQVSAHANLKAYTYKNLNLRSTLFDKSAGVLYIDTSHAWTKKPFSVLAHEAAGLLRAYKSSSSSSGKGNALAWSISCWYFCIMALSTWTSGGAKAGVATNSNWGLPTSFLANQRKGFSKL